MPTTFLNLTNMLLRRINEVQIDTADFATVKGVHAMAKDAVNASIEHIVQAEPVWPFEASSTTQLLTVGTEDYNWPAAMKKPKWNSFHVLKDDALSSNGHMLRPISRDVYHAHLKDDDDYAGATGVGLPLWVCEKHGFGFTVSPSPSKAYTVSFDYWAIATTLSANTDTSLVPSTYDEIIIQGALYHFYMFRDNVDQAQLAEKRFGEKLKHMRSILINKEDRMRSGLVIKGSRLSAGPNQKYF